MVNKNTVMSCIKSSPKLKATYCFIGSMAIRLLGLFIKTDKKMILFNSFGGKKYDDSPKALYEFMVKDERFADYKFVWAFHNIDSISIPNADVIKTDNVRYFITALKAGVWITNSGIERGLRFKKRNTIYINTWHGTPIKYMGADEPENKGKKLPKSNFDRQNAQSEFEADVFSRVFNIPINHMIIFGYPRNDILVNHSEQIKKQYKEKLGISPDKKVILYAPTFREYERDEERGCVLKPPIDIKKWKSQLSNEYTLLVRCHYEISKLLNIDLDNSFAIDVSSYPSLNDLMLASDMLISDYSSIIFDYAIIERPILLFTYDYDTYNQKRGMYFDIRTWLPGGSVTEDELIELIKTLDYEKAIKQVRSFQQQFVTEFGNATSRTVDELWAIIGGKRQ